MHRVRSNWNVSGLVDSADGSLDAKYEYGAFGETLRVGGSAIADDSPFRFSTKYLDSDGARKRVDGDAEGVARRVEEAGALWALMRQSGLIYYGFRYYSPSLGRFLNRDPLGEAGGTNLYGFVENDPVNGWDVMANRATGDASLTDLMNFVSVNGKNVSVFTRNVPIGKANQVKEWWKRLYENPGIYHFAGRQCTTTVCRSLRRAGISNVRTLKPKNLAKKLRKRGWEEQ